MEGTLTESGFVTWTGNGQAAAPSYDERRGEHLLSPGDIVRHGSSFWEVTGVFLGTDPGASKVTMRRHDGVVEYTVPLQLLEACSIFLLADRRQPS